jgi:hypothetical protein
LASLGVTASAAEGRTGHSPTELWLGHAIVAMNPPKRWASPKTSPPMTD